jgi:hypothetical protein
LLVATARAESLDGATAVQPASITDNASVVWSLADDGKVLRNGSLKYSWTGKLLLWYGKTLYLQSLTDKWYLLNRSTGAATAVAGDPRVAVPPPPRPRNALLRRSVLGDRQSVAAPGRRLPS